MKPLSFATFLVLSTIGTKTLAVPLDISDDIQIKESNQAHHVEAQVTPIADTENLLASHEQLERRSYKRHDGCGCGHVEWWDRKRNGNTENLSASSEPQRRWHQNNGGCGMGCGCGCGYGKWKDSKRTV